MIQKKSLLLVAAILLGSALMALALQTSAPTPTPTSTSPLIPSGWSLTPYGKQSPLGGLPLGIAASPDGRRLLVTNNGMGLNNGIDHHSLMYLDAATGSLLQEIVPQPNSLFAGVAFSADGRYAYASGGGSDRILKYAVGPSQLSLVQTAKLVSASPVADREDGVPAAMPAGIALSPDGQMLAVAGSADSAIHLLRAADLSQTGAITIGRPGAFFPYAVQPGPGSKVYVGGWGAEGTRQLFEADVPSGVVTALPSGHHPSALALSSSGRRLFVANAGSDSISVVDLASRQLIRTLPVAPAGTLLGASPVALALSRDDRRLYVADAGLNAVAVLDPEAASPLQGMVPTGWYPSALVLSAQDRLSVVNAKGTGSGPNLKGPVPIDAGRQMGAAGVEYVGSMIRGTLSTFSPPTGANLRNATDQVVRNDRLGRGPTATDPLVPAGRGQASMIKHVIYVIKENRTYDQVFGDIRKGNGDPSLTIFGAAITPNQHKLANEFVLLDNFYADAETSAAGHYWATAAVATDYVERTWPQDYSNRAAFPLGPEAFPDSGFIWDAAYAAGITYRDYGEFTRRPMPEHLDGHSHPSFPPFDLRRTDQERVDAWAKEFREFERTGELPQLEILRLPNDHTAGTVPGYPSPKSMIADNDLAVGRLVDIVSHSRFWKDTAILVTEDDAQDGRDHVDAHRTLALVVSPYSRLGTVDHTPYDTASMLRTIELILGLNPMTQFDAVATPMRGSFSPRLDLRPYSAVQPDVPVALNTEHSPGAHLSMTLDFSSEDRNQGEELEDILYLAARVDQAQLALVSRNHR